MRILLIEDDHLIGDGLHVGLTELNFNVDWFTDGRIGKEALFSAPYDAVILDLTLPKIDGLDILKTWREHKLDIPVLILTARDRLEQRIEGLQRGADDYLCKPFALSEVAARLQALIRRRYGQYSEELKFGDITLNTTKQQVTVKNKPVILTAKEISLLELFLHNRNSVLSKHSIQEKLYNWDDSLSSNAVEVHIHNLRQKLRKDIIQTVYGMGYQLGKSQ